jgi:hypothetical protein
MKSLDLCQKPVEVGPAVELTIATTGQMPRRTWYIRR